MRELCYDSERLVDRVLACERVTITREGEPVAELVPIRRRPLSAEALVDRFRGLPAIDPVAFRADIDAVVDQAL